MAIILDHISGRYFEKDTHELARIENEINMELAYDYKLCQWKKTEITYNDLMSRLFDAPSIAAGDCIITFDMPITLELFEQTTEYGQTVFAMHIA